MDIISTITHAAKIAHVSGTLLVAICSHESNGFKENYNPNDRGTPSIGSCQLKKATAAMLGFKGTSKELMDSKVNAKYAALYLKYQQNRPGYDSWLKITAAYNAGSFLPSKYNPQCPKNMGYIKLVQQKLPEDYKNRLNCGNEEVAGNP
jgi:soluble lytic murein transglycosylase-like protein